MRTSFKYSGHDEDMFTPTNICVDHMSHVLIADEFNDRVHVLDKDGHFLHYIKTSGSLSCSVDVNNVGHLWVGRRGGDVEIFKNWI